MTNNAESSRKPRLAIKLLAAAAFAILLLVVIAAFAIPPIASSMVRSAMERSVSDGIAGSLALDSVELSWSGPQRFQRITLVDDAGNTIADISAQADVGLLALALGSRDLGVVRLEGELNLERSGEKLNLLGALESPPGPAATVAPPAAADPKRPISIPTNLAFELDVAGLVVRYIEDDASGNPSTLAQATVNASGSYASGSASFSLDTLARDQRNTLSATITADNLTDASGLLTLDSADFELKSQGSLSPEAVELFASALVPSATGSISLDRAPDVGAIFEIGIESRNGRLVLADASVPPKLSFQTPRHILDLAAGGRTAVRLYAAPKATLSLQELDLPLPARGTLFDGDYRNARLVVALTTSEISGEITREGADRPTPFALEPFTATLFPISAGFDLAILAEITASIENAPAGKLAIDLRATGMLDRRGRLRIAQPPVPMISEGGAYPAPEFLRAKLVAAAIPTTLLQPLADRFDIDLREIAGESIDVDLRSGVRQPSARAPVGFTLDQQEGEFELMEPNRPYLALSIGSDKAHAWIDLFIEHDRFVTRNKGIEIQSDAAAPILRRLLAGSDIGIDGEGKAIIAMQDIEIPFSGGRPNLGAATGHARVNFGMFNLLLPGHTTHIAVETIDTAVTLEHGKPSTWGIDARASYERQRFAIVGNGDLFGFRAKAGEGEDTLGIDLSRTRLSGKLRVLDAPTSLASLISERAAAILQAAAGDTIGGDITAVASQDDVTIDLSLQGDRLVAQGALTLTPDEARIDEKGVILTFFDPTDLLNSLATRPDQPQNLVFQSSGEAFVTLSHASIPIPRPGDLFDIAAVRAQLDLDITRLSASAVNHGTGRSLPISLPSARARLSHDPAGALSLATDINGRFADQPFTAQGSLSLSGIRSNSSRLDLSGATPAGSWSAKSVPTAIIALIAPEQAALVREAVGPTVDLTIAADGKSRAWLINASAENLGIGTALAVRENALVLGPTTGGATLTPEAVELVVRRQAPGLDPAPSLRQPVRLSIEADEWLIPLSGEGRLGAASVPTATVRAESKIILDNLPLQNDEQAASLGLDSLTVRSTKSTPPELALSASIFDPDRPSVSIASLAASTPFPPDGITGQLRVTDGDSRALDQMLAAQGLLTDLLGESFAVTFDSPRPEPGASTRLVANVRSPRLTLDADLNRTDKGMTLAEPVSVKWNVAAAFAQRTLFPLDPEDTNPLTVMEDIPLTLSIRELELGPAEKPLDPQQFKLDADLSIGRAILTDAAGKTHELIPKLGTVRTDGDALLIKLTSDGAPVAQGQSTPPALDYNFNLDARIEDYSTDGGRPSFNQARITATFDGDLPSHVIDALGSYDGLLTALAGPTISATIQTDKLSTANAQGAIKGDFDTPYIEAAFIGALAPSQSGPIIRLEDTTTFRVKTITNEASQRVFRFLLPLLESFEKTQGDDPAVVITKGLSLPIDGATQSLNGSITIDPGTMQFRTRSFFDGVLKTTHNRNVGSLGRRLQPFQIKLNSGIASFEKVMIPAGDFDIESFGTIDLNNKTMDVYALLPFYTMQSDFAAVVNNIPGLSKATRIPIRIQGPFEKPNTSIDGDMLIKMIPENLGKGAEDFLKSPGKLLEDLFGGSEDK